MDQSRAFKQSIVSDDTSIKFANQPRVVHDKIKRRSVSSSMNLPSIGGDRRLVVVAVVVVCLVASKSAILFSIFLRLSQALHSSSLELVSS